jgi:hypothetical protein
VHTSQTGSAFVSAVKSRRASCNTSSQGIMNLHNKLHFSNKINFTKTRY